ncbi:MAG: HNH endonuclease, partial [Williamsia herbipolensis]|nr:HNH endonuclease [Williamsia herbipolensis]
VDRLRRRPSLMILDVGGGRCSISEYLMPPPPPSPTPQTPDIAGTVLRGVWNGVSQFPAHYPWLVALLAVVVVARMVRIARVAIHNGPRDRVRLFTSADKKILLARAGHRCEHHSVIGGRRCSSTEKLEADHIHPWSRGGSTHLSNGQILCKTHNREKRAAIPWNRTLLRMAENRAAYYPTDVDRAIVRKTRPVAKV